MLEYASVNFDSEQEGNKQVTKVEDGGREKEGNYVYLLMGLLFQSYKQRMKMFLWLLPPFYRHG